MKSTIITPFKLDMPLVDVYMAVCNVSNMIKFPKHKSLVPQAVNFWKTLSKILVRNIYLAMNNTRTQRVQQTAATCDDECRTTGA